MMNKETDSFKRFPHFIIVIDRFARENKAIS